MPAYLLKPEVVKLLHAEHNPQGVSVLPGVGFGECASGYVRVSLAQPINVLRPAFDRIERYCRVQSDVEKLPDQME